MSEALFSPSWYRVAALTPRLRSHAHVHRHQYREETWYVLQDQSNQRCLRFTPSAYAIIGLMDGRRSVEELWELASTTLGDDAPTQPEVVQLLCQLHAADVLQCNIAPDVAELLHRYERHQHQHWQKRLMSLFSWQVPVVDPDRMLNLVVPLVRPLFSWGGAVGWSLLVGSALLVGASHWSELTADLIDRVTTPKNLLMLWVLFPLIKLLHELGHAFAVKVFGGDVHDMGIMVLVGSPVPYVDASASSALPSKWQRVAVGAAGMLVELALASIALYVWVSAEPGVLRTLTYNIILIAGISTVIFNANPLLRFDGYYMLADYLEIPNLRQRANNYLGYLCERYLFGRKDGPIPQATRGERSWFLSYSISSFAYRLLVTSAIFFFLADQFFWLGLLFALFVGVTGILLPVGQGVTYLFSSPRLRQVRGRAFAVSAGCAALVAVGVCLVPVPFRTRAEGIVWIPEAAIVRAGVDGFVDQVVARPGMAVSRGEVLVVCRDPGLQKDEQVLLGELQEVEARIREQVPEDLVKAKMLEEEKRYIQEKLARTKEQLRDLVIRANTDGTFVLPRAADWPGRFIKKGSVLGQVVDLKAMTVRTIVEQPDIDLIRHGTRAVHVRLVERLAEPIAAAVSRVIPAASDELPSPALGSEGGGQVPMDAKKQKAMRTVFQVDLTVPLAQGIMNVGGRVQVRFDHGSVPLLAQWYRQGRQVFLSRFNA